MTLFKLFSISSQVINTREKLIIREKRSDLSLWASVGLLHFICASVTLHNIHKHLQTRLHLTLVHSTFRFSTRSVFVVSLSLSSSCLV